MTYLPSKFPPGAADTILGSTIGSSFAGTLVELSRVTVDRTGLWSASAALQTSGGVEGAGYNMTLEIRYNGVVAGTRTLSQNSGQSGAGGGLSVAPTQITSGQLISLWANKQLSVSASTTFQELRATFTPTAGFPQ